MTEFDLSKFELTGKTTRVSLSEIWPGAHLDCAPAHTSNGEFLRAVLEKNAQNRAAGRVEPEDDVERSVQARRDDRALFPILIKGWAKVIDKDGKEAEFTPENVRKLCAALPDWIIDRIRNRTLVAENFFTRDLGKA